MKICLIQPPYTLIPEKGGDCFRKELEMLRAVRAADVIVLPEYSDVLFAERDRNEMIRAHEENFPELVKTCREAALRCGAAVFFNAPECLHMQPSPAGIATNSITGKNPSGRLRCAICPRAATAGVLLAAFFRWRSARRCGAFHGRAGAGSRAAIPC